MGIGSYYSKSSPPPFAAQFAEITVDIETGQLIVDRLVMAVDGGVIVNPATASGQIEGGMAQALGYAVCEEMVYDDEGRIREKDLVDYHIFRANEMPVLETIFIETYEPTIHLVSRPWQKFRWTSSSGSWQCSSGCMRANVYPIRSRTDLRALRS